MASSTPLEVRTYSYIQEPVAGSNFILNSVQDTYRPVRLSDTVITRGSDVYNTHAVFNTDRTSASYSYGFPTSVQQWSNLGGGTRQTDTVYAHNTSLWILGLPSTITKNSKLFDAFTYDTLGRITQHDRFGAVWKTYAYHTTVGYVGLPLWMKDGLNRVTYFRQWKRGVPQEVERNDAHKLFRTVDENGWTKSITDWRGTTTNYTYDNVGRLAGIDQPSPWTDTTIGYTYAGGNLVQTQTFGTERTTTTYDAMLRPTQVLKESLNGYGGNIYVKTDYDVMSRAAFTSLPSVSSGSSIGIQTSYDALGRVTQIMETASGGGTTTQVYLAGNKTRITDPLGNQTTHTSSGWGDPGDGNTIKTEQPEGITVDFTFDIYGNQLSIAQTKNDGSQHISSFEYDTRLRLCRRKILETGDTLYGYDNAGQLTAYVEGQASGSGCATPPPASAVVLAYDPVGRPSNTNFPGSTPDIDRTYDANGNMLTVNRGGVNWTYTYNVLDLVETETLSVDARTYLIDPTYDSNGALVSKAYPSGRTYNFVNDGYGRPTDVYYGGTAYLSGAAYHPNSKLSTLNRGIGGTYTQQLNVRQLVSSIGGNWGTSVNYSYDTVGRITLIDSPNNNYDRTFTYDGAGRLKTDSGPWGSGSYTYDRLGNISQKTQGSRIVDIQYNAANRVSNVRDSAVSSNWRTYSHDTRGNVTADGLHTYTYDDANQPIAVSGVDLGSFFYDGNLRRVKQSIDGKAVYSIYDKSGSLLTRDDVTASQVTDHINLGGQTFVRVTNGTPSYPLNDHLGTAYMVADQNGGVPAANTYSFTPFGETVGNDPGSNNHQGFTGHIEDETGLTYMQARYYDPVIGRFLSADPIGYADSLNVYAYVGNDPLNGIDASGMYECQTNGDLKTCVGTDAEVGEMTKEMVGYQLTGASEGFGLESQGVPLLSKVNDVGDAYGTDQAFGIPGLVHTYAVPNTVQPGSTGWGRHGSSRTDNGNLGFPESIQRGSIPSEHTKIGDIYLPVGMSFENFRNELDKNGNSGLWFPWLNDCHTSLENAAKDLNGLWMRNSNYPGRIN
jgi:RHS repeat-associated protein